jgi:hypothetical protein
VEGDNSPVSIDSRYNATTNGGGHGPVSKKLLVGIAEYIVWPPWRMGKVGSTRQQQKAATTVSEEDDNDDDDDDAGTTTLTISRTPRPDHEKRGYRNEDEDDVVQSRTISYWPGLGNNKKQRQ